MNIELTLIGKPGCHLCDDARLVVDQVVGEFRQDYPTAQVSYVEQNILEDDELLREHHDEIPVLKINGLVHNFWRIEPERFRAALEKLMG